MYSIGQILYITQIDPSFEIGKIKIIEWEDYPGNQDIEIIYISNYSITKEGILNALNNHDDLVFTSLLEADKYLSKQIQIYYDNQIERLESGKNEDIENINTHISKMIKVGRNG